MPLRTATVTMLVWAIRDPGEAFASIDWSLLLFLVDLFVVVHGITKSEAHLLDRYVPDLTKNAGSLGGLALAATRNSWTTDTHTS